MKQHIVDMTELSESRELMEVRPPRFMTFFIYALLAFLITALVWAWFAEIDIVVKVNGIVRPAVRESVIRNVNSGEIKQLNYREGQKVKKGELLYSIAAPELENQKESLINQKKRIEQEVLGLFRLEKSIREDKNLFDKTETEYYNRYLAHKYRYEQARSLSGKMAAQYKSEAIAAVVGEAKKNRDMIVEVDRQLKDIDERISSLYVTAPIEGTIQALQEFNIGEYMPGGIEVLKIMPIVGSDFKVEMMIPNRDIARVEVGQKVNYRIGGAGIGGSEKIVKGVIAQISNDVVLKQNGDNAIFIAEGVVQKDRSFDAKSIRMGMLCEARIITGRERILYILMEKLNFLSYVD